MLGFLKNSKIMLVVAHPDDEILGIGASMNKIIREQNANIHVVILGEGITSRSEQREVEKWKSELEIHRNNIKNAQAAIGYHSVSIYDFPDNRFDSVALLDIVKVIEKEKEIFLPDVVFTHHCGDLNIDHRRTFDAVMTSCRPMRDETVKTILSFETPSATEWQASNYSNPFIPNFFITFVESHLQAKITAMESYEFEKRECPHPRSPEALKILAQKRGIEIGKKFAEAFMLIRQIN